MAGYRGCSMSRNAVQAYINGKRPISKWNKETIIKRIREEIEDDNIELQCSLEKLEKLPLAVLKEKCLRYTEWHHTGIFYNETDFYALDIDYIEELTDEDVERLALDRKEELRRLRAEKTPEEKEAEKKRKAERKAERALIAEKKKLFKYQNHYKSLSGFLRSETVDLDKLREIRKIRIAERREELRKGWEKQQCWSLLRIDDDDFIDGYIK